jgi:hypothetical protein
VRCWLPFWAIYSGLRLDSGRRSLAWRRGSGVMDVNQCSDTSEVLYHFRTSERSRFIDPCNESQCPAIKFVT